uniref:Uncharacterized protein n=1 Tax=Knipowitschia caucasica TaxID=637954 RepID=A0AAV2L9S7_KNICA
MSRNRHTAPSLGVSGVGAYLLKFKTQMTPDCEAEADMVPPALVCPGWGLICLSLNRNIARIMARNSILPPASVCPGWGLICLGISGRAGEAARQTREVE